MASVNIINYINLIVHNIQFYTFFLFFLFFLIFSFIFSTSYYNLLFTYIRFILNCFYFIVFILLFIYFYILYLKYFNFLNNILFLNNFLNYNVFSETLILLAILVTLISWILLSERYLFKNLFFIIYFLIFIICTINMVYANNLLVMFIFFEFIFLPSLLFVYQFGYSKKVEKTILFLLVWTFSGSFLILVSLSYLYYNYSLLDLQSLFYIKFTTLEKNILYFLFFIGFGVKIPIWPFHYWLTKVHVEAPTGFSIFLSGFLVKTAFFCLIYFYYLLNDKFLNQISIIFILIGLLDASLRMWTSADIKRLIAFATIQEMNIILLIFFLSKIINYFFVNVFLLVHGIFSSFLFYLIDQIQKQSQSRNLTTLGGFSLTSNKLHLFIWIAILIFRGFPIFIKFFIEWELLSILFINYNFFGIFLFITANSLAVLGFARIWFIILYGQPVNYYKKNDIIKKDLYLGIFMVNLLFFLNFFLFLFIWLVFLKNLLSLIGFI